MSELENEATSPETSPVRLQELANDYPQLRPLIAMNPATYPALVEWLGELGDPAVNVALAQRAASTQGSAAPRRVSVMGRSAGEPTPPAQSPMPPSTASTVDEDEQGQATPVTTGSRQHLTTMSPKARVDTANPAWRGSLVVGLIVAAVVLALVYFGFRFLHKAPAETDEAGSASNQSQDSEQSEAEQSDATPQIVEQLPEEPVVYPAPETALELNHFVAPSGNIACELTGDKATCTINSYYFADEAQAACGQGPVTIVATKEGAAIDCAQTPITASGATTLSYGDYATQGNIACRSTEYGVACWDTRSGAGFGVSRGGYLIGLDEPVDPEAFPWN